MQQLAVLDIDENGVIKYRRVILQKETIDFEAWLEDNQKALIDWAQVTHTINIGVIQYLNSIGALWVDEHGAYQVNFANFTVSSFIDGILHNERYLPEDMTTHYGYIIVKKAIKGLKKIFPKGRELPMDIGAAIKYLRPILPVYIAYSRRNPDISNLLDVLIPELDTFLQPITKDTDAA